MSNKPITDRWPALIDLFPAFVDWPTVGYDKYGNFDWQQVYDVLKNIEAVLGYATAKVAVYRSGAQVIADDTMTSINFDEEYVDIGDYHESITNPSRITIPAGCDGDHIFSIRALIELDPLGDRRIQIRKNGTDVVYDTNIFSPSGDDPNLFFFSHVEFGAEAGDYYEFRFWQDTGGNLNIEGGAGSTEFKIKRLTG